MASRDAYYAWQKDAAGRDVPRGVCPVCGRSIAISASGVMRDHRGTTGIPGIRPMCAGVGKGYVGFAAAVDMGDEPDAGNLGDEPDLEGEDMGDLPPACEWGPPSHCNPNATVKQHAKCAHHPGGGHHGGSMGGDGHLWTCPCKCHDDAGEIRPRCPHPVHGDADPAAAALLTAALAGIDVDLAYAVEGAAAGNALTVLEYLTAVVAAADRARQVAVDVAKSRGSSWQLVGDVLGGVTKQSAQARWGRHASRVLPPQPGATLLDVLAQDDRGRYGADAASGSRP